MNTCISTGIYGYRAEPAARIAIETVRASVDDRFDGVVFCCFSANDLAVHERLLEPT